MRKGAFFLLLGILLSGCSLLPTPPTPEPPPPGGAVLYTENFGAGAETRWHMEDTDHARIWVESGRLHILVKTPAWDAWSNDEGVPSFDDFRCDVDATQISGPDDNDYGVVFRYADDRNFYLFEISGDGHASFRKLVDLAWTTIVPWTEFPGTVTAGAATNHITVVAVGSQFSFYVNNEKLFEASDSSFSAGGPGVFAGSFSEPNVHVAFDNLVIREME